MATTSLSFPYYVIEANDRRHNAGGLHTLTAPHVLTLWPGEGDTIWAVGHARVWRDGTTLRVQAGTTRHDEPVEIRSHPGRSPLGGEDGLEDAHGHDVLVSLLREQVGDAGKGLRLFTWSEVGWRYAPVAAEVIPEDDSAPEPGQPVCADCGAPISAHGAKYRGTTRCRACANRVKSGTFRSSAYASEAARLRYERDASERGVRSDSPAGWLVDALKADITKRGLASNQDKERSRG